MSHFTKAVNLFRRPPKSRRDRLGTGNDPMDPGRSPIRWESSRGGASPKREGLFERRRRSRLHSDRFHKRKLRALDFWRGPLTIEALPGGITNRNFLVRDHGQGRSFVARICEERPWLGIDRSNEVACQRAAWALGVAPEVVHLRPGILISAHLKARTLSAEDVRDPDRLGRLGGLLRHLHEGWDQLSGMILYFSAFQTVQTYAQTAETLGARLPEDIGALLDDARGLARRLAPFTPVLCHNDLLAANLLEDPSTGRLQFVDWEYAGVGHPLFDLANIASNSNLSAEAEAILLRSYRGSLNRRELAELRVMRALSSLREALWAVIQTRVSDLDFDYHQYAREHFAAYREARRRLAGELAILGPET